MSSDDHLFVQVDEISQSIHLLIDIWYKVLNETEILIQSLLQRLEERQSQVRQTTCHCNHTETRRQSTTFSAANRGPESPRDHSVASSTSSRTSRTGIENLQQLLDEDDASRGNNRRSTTRTSVSVNEQRQSTSPSVQQSQGRASVDREEVTTSGRTEEVQVVATQVTSEGSSSGSGRSRRRNILAKTVCRENIKILEDAISHLQEVKCRMCTEVVCSSRGNQSYDDVATEIDDVVQRLQSVGLADTQPPN